MGYELPHVIDFLLPLGTPLVEIIVREGAGLVAKVIDGQELNDEEWSALHAIRAKAEREMNERMRA